MQSPAHDQVLMQSVVISNGRYKGWRCIFAGNGQMEFAKESQRFGVREDRHGRDDWMMYCWGLAVVEIDQREDKTAKEAKGK